MAKKKSMAVTFSPDDYNLNAEPVTRQTTETPAEQTAGGVVDQQKRAPGRPAGRRTVGKDNGVGMTLYLTLQMKEEVKSCSFFSGVDQADIVRTALGLFLAEHSKYGHLDEEGYLLVRKQIENTTTK